MYLCLSYIFIAFYISLILYIILYLSLKPIGKISGIHFAISVKSLNIEIFMKLSYC